MVCTVPCRSLLTPSYYHSFGMTENYIVFMEQPFKLDIVRMATAYMRGVNWASCLKYSPDENVRSVTNLNVDDLVIGEEEDGEEQSFSVFLFLLDSDLPD